MSPTPPWLWLAGHMLGKFALEIYTQKQAAVPALPPPSPQNSVDNDNKYVCFCEFKFYLNISQIFCFSNEILCQLIFKAAAAAEG